MLNVASFGIGFDVLRLNHSWICAPLKIDFLQITDIQLLNLNSNLAKFHCLIAGILQFLKIIMFLSRIFFFLHFAFFVNVNYYFILSAFLLFIIFICDLGLGRCIVCHLRFVHVRRSFIFTQFNNLLF